jgi:hypothetical protein
LNGVAIDSGGGKDTLDFIIGLMFIFTILSANTVEVTAKGLVALLLAVLAAIMSAFGTQREHRSDRVAHVEIKPTTLDIEKTLLNTQLRTVLRLVFGALSIGAVVAVAISVITAMLATTILDKLN